MASKKPSGAFYKRLNKQRENNARKMKNQMKTWLNKTLDKSNTDSVNDIDTSNGQENANKYEGLELRPVQVVVVETLDVEKVYQQQGNDVEVHMIETVGNSGISNIEIDELVERHQLNFYDPVTWPLITDKVRCSLVEHGPEQTKNEYYPTDSGNRHFNKIWFDKILSNGEKVNRQWMMYSTSKDSLFCFPCLLFSKVKLKQNCFADLSKGFCKWAHLNPRVADHENSFEHRKCYLAWKDLEKRLKEGKTIDDDIEKEIKNETEKWRNILKVVVDVIMFCAKNNLSLRGSTHLIGEPRCGIFLNTIELISHYNRQLAEHIATVKARNNSTSYFSPQIQNELLTLLDTS